MKNTDVRPLGELLVSEGVLTRRQVEDLLRVQPTTCLPLGALAQRRLGVRPEAVERAWSRQHAARGEAVDPGVRGIDPALVRLIDRRRAWQFEVVPIACEEGLLLVATTRRRLARATAFAWRHFGRPVRMLVAEDQALGAALQRHYPWPAGRRLFQARRAAE